MNTSIQRAALAASLFAVVLVSGCASFDGVSSSQIPEGDVRQPHQPGADPILEQMAAESQLG